MMKKVKIYIVPRARAGPSYLDVELEGVDKTKVQYCPISKGYSMQDVSSFTLGPIVGEGLCLVNAAFSKMICLVHLEGGGAVDLKRKNFWKRSKNPGRKLEFSDDILTVDGVDYNVYEWLANNEDLWYENWNKWRRSIALCSRGDFHWGDGLGEVVAYHNSKGKKDKYIDFVTWKKNCYILPSYQLLPDTEAFKFLKKLYDKGIPLGLVHPMGMKLDPEKPLNRAAIENLYNCPHDMGCQPYVVAGLLLDARVY
jgi:hypothetical protein